MDEESCNKAFASKQEMVRHSEKSCSMKEFEQFPGYPVAVAHSTTKHVLPKSAEHPNLEPSVTLNDLSSVTSQDVMKSSVLELEHFEHERKQMQIPTPNIHQNETKQIITHYVCSDCGAKFRDKEKICEHALKVHKKKIVLPETKKTENLTGPSQVIFPCEKCYLPILTQNLDFHKKTCDGPKDYCFEGSRRNLINKHYSRYPPQDPDGCGECGHKFTQKSDLKRHILKVHYNFKKYPCLKRSKQFTSKQILECHLKICGKSNESEHSHQNHDKLGCGECTL